MTPNKRGRRPANVREMPPPNEGHTPEIPQTLAPESSETTSSAPARGLPAPKKFDLPPEELFRYYRSLDDAFPGRLVLYGYRTLPVTDVTQPLSEDELRLIQQKKKKEPPKNICIEKACPVKEPADWNRWACETFGAGDYHFKLNDQHPSVKKTIAMTTTKGEGSLRDWNSFPPVLHYNEAGEVDQVVLNDPLNESYVRWAKLNGIKFPGDTDSRQATKEDEETEMASVVETMARQNEALTDKVVRMAETSQQKNGTAPVDPASRGQLGAVETVVEGAKQAMGVMGGAMKQMMENQVKAADPEQHVRSAIEMAKLMQPPAGNGNSDLLAIMKLQLDQQEKNAQRSLEQQEKSFTRLIDMQRESHQATVAILTGRLDSLEKQKSETPASSEENALKTYQRIRSIFRDMEEEEAPANDGPAWLGPVLSLGEKAISGIAETTRNLAAMRANQVPMSTVQEPTAGLPAAAPAPSPTPQEKEMNMQRQYAMMIHKPLVEAIKAGRLGYEFAAGLISEAGQPAYDALVANGYDGLTRFLQGYPPLWDELMLPPIGGIAADKFLKEFLDRAKVMDAMQMVKGQPVRKGPTVNQ